MSCAVAHRPVITGMRAVVSTGHPLASVDALHVLRQGGNAFDAALTAAAVLAVVKPYHCGPGGDVFAVCYSAREKTIYCLNGTGRSPGFIDRERYKNSIPAHSALAATIPGAVDAWIQLAKRFASRSLAELWKPAIEYAQNGFPVFPHLARVIDAFSTRRGKDPAWAKIFRPGGNALRVNELLIQRDLARTMMDISEHGGDSFYDGPVAASIIRTVEERGGSFSLRDLREHRSLRQEPLRSTYRGYEVYVPPPNSYGLLLLLQLKLLEREDLSRLDPNGPETICLQMSAQAQAAVDASLWIADAEWVDRKELESFLGSYPYAKVKRSVGTQISIGSGEGTTYISTADAQGNWVSLIQSLHESFGCGVVVDGTGVILNNRMRGFNLEPGHSNELAARKRPAHTLSPVLVCFDTAPVLVIGTPGGIGQTQFLVQILCGLIDFNMDIQQAIERPRWQMKSNGAAQIEMRFPTETQRNLENKGFKIEVTAPWNLRMGGAEGILLDRKTGVFQAGADPRRDGYAVGY